MSNHILFFIFLNSFINLNCRYTKQSCLPFVSSYYTVNTLRDMYAGEVNPIPHPDEWRVPIGIKSRKVGVPTNPKQAGRPRTSRIRSVGEPSSRTHNHICSRCKQHGHYRSRCTTYIPTLQVEELVVPRARRPKSCSICHDTSHTRRKCPFFNIGVN